MNPRRLWTFSVYEIRRAVARKKVLALVIITVLIETLPYYILKAVNGSVVPVAAQPYIWVVGIIIPQAVLLQFTALLIAAGSMSEEYEQGTAELLLSKPVTRDEYFAGKYLGGFLLLAMIILLSAVLGVSSATVAFGSQLGLEVLPIVLSTQVFSSIVFYSIAFMAGELIRRSSLSYIVASVSFLILYVVGTLLRVLYQLTGTVFYQQVNLYLPTSAVDSLPVLVAQPGLPPAILPYLRLLGGNAVETSTWFSAGLISLFALTAVIVARSYFNWADVSKKVS